ncbi:MAG TPA: thioredoxin family protein [Planctomycetota bacterium]|jgi:thiol-disulfide isomerase/thioredoxin|nr:thioredoxin family protein [Planctomycetota bacterium]
MRMPRRFGRGGFPLLLALLPDASSPAQEPGKTKEEAKAAPIYDGSADARAQVDAALARAKKENRRVLVVFGADWCGWCRKLHGLFARDEEIARLLRYEYEQVPVDVGRFDKNEDLAGDLGAAVRQNGIPFLTVLDADGKPLVHQETSSLEVGPAYDPAKVKDFLGKWAAPPLDAEKVVADARARAEKEGKKVFLRFGAPW